MSTYWPETNENAAFEELVGNHGGLGGEQTDPFVLFPAEWELWTSDGAHRGRVGLPEPQALDGD